VFSKNDLEEVLQLATKNGGDFADIFIEHKQGVGISCEDDRIERLSTGIDSGAGIRVISGDATAYAYTNNLTKEGLLEAAEIVRHAAKGEPGEFNFDLTQGKPVFDYEITKRPDEVSIDDKVEAVLKANKQARAMDPRIKQVSVGYGDVIQRVTVANTDGNYVEEERIRTRFLVNAVAAEGSTIQTGYDARGGILGFELFEEAGPEEIATSAVERALLQLSAKPAPAGKMAVVMAGEAGGTMVHEACGHGLEADLVQKQLSVYQGKMGEKVASEYITVIDDATIPKKYGSYRFDDEGVAGQKKELIKNGILKDYMYDKLTAMQEDRESTGNGRRESYQHKPIPRMSNTYIAAGKMDPDKIIGSIENGLLVKKMGGGQVNTTNGDFVFDVGEGFLIEDGQITTAVRGATLTGNGPDVLQIVDMVGSDLGYTIGTCGKDGQGAPVSDAQPTIRIPEIVVGGTAHGEEGPQKKALTSVEDIFNFGTSRIRRL
jgi:TldD protein